MRWSKATARGFGLRLKHPISCNPSFVIATPRRSARLNSMTEEPAVGFDIDHVGGGNAIERNSARRPRNRWPILGNQLRSARSGLSLVSNEPDTTADCRSKPARMILQRVIGE